MRPSTPHYTSPRDLIERSRIQAGVVNHHGPIRGAIIAVLCEGIIAIIAVGLWHIFH